MVTIYEFLTSSQRSFRVLGPLLPTDQLFDLCYRIGFEKRFLEKCSYQYHWNFRSLLPDLFDGSFFSEDGSPNSEAGQSYGQNLIQGFVIVLLSVFQNRPELPFEMQNALTDSLNRDGIRFDGNRLVNASKQVVDEPRELTIVENLVRESVHDQPETILHHFENGHRLFNEAKYHPSAGEWRSFLEEILRGIWRLTRKNRTEFKTHAETPSMKDLFQFLQKSGFFDSDEELAFRSSYGFLSAGGHPGIGDRDTAYLSQTLALTFGHALLLKLDAWQNNGYLHF